MMIPSTLTFNYLTFLILLCILSTCTPLGGHQTKPKIMHPDQRIELERIAFLPPNGRGWKMYRHSQGDITLRLDSNANKIPRTIKVNINSFDWVYRTMQFDTLRKTFITRAALDTKSFGRNIFSEKSTAEFVSRGGMRCMKAKYRFHIYNPPREFSSGVFGDGMQETSEYLCQQPDQPNYLPYISISLFQLAPPGASLVDEEFVLEPVFKSMTFQPVDPLTSLGYIRWKKTYKKNQEVRRQNEIKKR